MVDTQSSRADLQYGLVPEGDAPSADAAALPGDARGVSRKRLLRAAALVMLFGIAVAALEEAAPLSRRSPGAVGWTEAALPDTTQLSEDKCGEDAIKGAGKEAAIEWAKAAAQKKGGQYLAELSGLLQLKALAAHTPVKAALLREGGGRMAVVIPKTASQKLAVGGSAAATAATEGLTRGTIGSVVGGMAGEHLGGKVGLKHTGGFAGSMAGGAAVGSFVGPLGTVGGAVVGGAGYGIGKGIGALFNTFPGGQCNTAMINVDSESKTLYFYTYKDSDTWRLKSYWNGWLDNSALNWLSAGQGPDEAFVLRVYPDEATVFATNFFGDIEVMANDVLSFKYDDYYSEWSMEQYRKGEKVTAKDPVHYDY